MLNMLAVFFMCLLVAGIWLWLFCSPSGRQETILDDTCPAQAFSVVAVAIARRKFHALAYKGEPPRVVVQQPTIFA